MSKAKAGKVIPMTVPMGSTSNSDIAQTNVSLEAALRRKRHAEVTYYTVPGMGSDMYRRRIVAARQDAKQVLLDDVPDIEDCYLTDLPWVGYVTFKGASRQFRSKTALGVVVDVVREFDGYLYLLCVSQVAKDNPPPPGLIEKSPMVVNGGYMELRMRRELTDKEFIEHFVGIPKYTDGVIASLAEAGYVYDAREDWFWNPKRPNDDKIVVTRYGKIVDAPKPKPEVKPAAKRRRAASGLDLAKNLAAASA